VLDFIFMIFDNIRNFIGEIMRKTSDSFVKKIPNHGWIGLFFVGIFWFLNWTLSSLRTHWFFFPLWLGYCLSVDALTVIRKGDSLLTRKPRAYAGLFLISILGWWLFEVINLRTQNWSYIGRDLFSVAEFNIYASLSFSTVVPAVFGSAELIGTFNWVKRIEPGTEKELERKTVFVLSLVGILMFILMMVWPGYFFPFVWLSVFFIIEPLNIWLGYRSLISSISKGDWRPVISLFVGVLICGFFWEMWNYYSFPKWVYHVPFVDFARIFEMPLLGYGGYLPFSLELFALYHFVIGVFDRKELNRYIQIIQE
jgi:hypothetical protein